jgi:hypothetical protein
MPDLRRRVVDYVREVLICTWQRTCRSSIVYICAASHIICFCQIIFLENIERMEETYSQSQRWEDQASGE